MKIKPNAHNANSVPMPSRFSFFQLLLVAIFTKKEVSIARKHRFSLCSAAMSLQCGILCKHFRKSLTQQHENCIADGFFSCDCKLFRKFLLNKNGRQLCTIRTTTSYDVMHSQHTVANMCCFAMASTGRNLDDKNSIKNLHITVCTVKCAMCTWIAEHEPAIKI